MIRSSTSHPSEPSEDEAQFDRARELISQHDLPALVDHLKAWATLAGSNVAAFTTVGNEVIVQIEESGLSPETIAAGVAEYAAWVPDLEPALVELIVRAFTDDPTLVAGLPAPGISLVCLMIYAWLVAPRDD